MKAFLVLSTFLIMASPASAQSVMGLWQTESGTATVRIAECAADYADGSMVGTPCGIIETADIPETAPGTDENNPNPDLRDQPIIGLTMLDGFEAARNGVWKRGRIYNPEDGKSYKSRIALSKDDPNILEVKGCVGPFCQTQRWARVE